MPGLVGRLLLRAFRIYKDRAKRSLGDDVTIRKAEVGEEEGMVDLEAMRVRGGARGAPNEVNRQRDPINQVHVPRGRV